MYFKISHNSNSPIICSIPHAGIKIPAEFQSDYLVSFEELHKEALDMADLYTDELYEELASVSSYIQSNTSRLVVDIERFPNEEDEPMSSVGMSAFYTRTSKGEVLRTINEERREELQKIYDEYHKSFTDVVTSSLTAHNTALIVDCHSFPSVPRQYESDQSIDRPDICLGVDAYHTPEKLVNVLRAQFEKVGYSVKINSPFAGTIVPLSFYKKENKVVSIMIEVNRSLYMDEETHKKLTTFSSTGRLISRCIIQGLNEFHYTL